MSANRPRGANPGPTRSVQRDDQVEHTSPGRERRDFFRFARATGVDPREIDYHRLALAVAAADRVVARIDDDLDALIERIRSRGVTA